jgi:hypothetical protein
MRTTPRKVNFIQRHARTSKPRIIRSPVVARRAYPRTGGRFAEVGRLLAAAAVETQGSCKGEIRPKSKAAGPFGSGRRKTNFVAP